MCLCPPVCPPFQVALIVSFVSRLQLGFFVLVFVLIRLKSCFLVNMPSAAAASTTHSDVAGSTAAPSPRKLTQDELQRSANRLATTTRTQVALKPLVESSKLSKEQEEKSIKRLYEESIASQKRKQAELEKRHEESTSPKHLSHTRALAPSEEQEAVSRLYDKSIEHKHIVQAELEKKFSTQQPRKRLDGGTQSEVNQRLYLDSISKHRDGHTKLYEKYVLEQEPKMAKRTAEELRSSAAKLHAGEK